MVEDMSENKIREPSGVSGRPSTDTLSMVIAVCAVLISAASFVATYVQSAAALQEVKAETWPFLQIDLGNFNNERREYDLYYYVENAGVGPAHIKQFSMKYDGKPVASLYQLIVACCEAEAKALEEKFGDRHGVMVALQSVTDTPAPSLLPAGGKNLAFNIPFNEHTAPLWRAVDRARNKLDSRACYCSLLDDCYETDFKDDPVEVDECRPEPEANFNG